MRHAGSSSWWNQEHSAFWKSPQRAPAVADEDWHEVYSILYRVQKNDLVDTWVNEEANSIIARLNAGDLRKVWGQDADAGQVLLGPREFVAALKNPAEGDWPPVRTNGIPLIDPGAESSSKSCQIRPPVSRPGLSGASATRFSTGNVQSS